MSCPCRVDVQLRRPNGAAARLCVVVHIGERAMVVAEHDTAQSAGAAVRFLHDAIHHAYRTGLEEMHAAGLSVIDQIAKAENAP